MNGTRIRIAAALLLVAGAIAYVAMTVAQKAGVPGDEDWAQAAAAVRAGWQEGDLVVFSPAWAHAGAPVLRGLAADVAEQWDWYQASKHRRVWVVASRPHREPEPPEGWQAVSRTEAGRMTVHLWTPPADRTLAWEGMETLHDASVFRGDGTSRQPCTTWQDGRWSCGAAHPWQNVAPVSRDIAGRQRRVIWAHARDNGDPLEIRWTGVPEGRTLTVHVGLTQRAIEQDTGAPVVFEVRLGDRVAVRRTIDIHESGWFRHDIDIAGKGPQDVTIRVVARRNQDRQLCFTADVWR